MGAKRPFWSFIILAAAAVLLINALAGSSSSPLPRLLHIARVPGWWPLVLAVGTGVVLGGIFNRGRLDQSAPGGGGGTRAKAAAPAGRGRHAVPRHVRRQRERDARRRERTEKVQAAALEAEEAARRAQEAAAAPPAPPQGVLGRLRAMVGRVAGPR